MFRDKMAQPENLLHWLDYVITFAVLFISLGIGFFFAFFHGGQKTKAEYLLGNRQMSLGPVCVSLFVTFQSAVSLIGIPAEVFSTGTMVMFLFFGLSIAYIVGYFTVVPLFYPLHLTSMYEYLDMRFDSSVVRLLGTVIGMVQTILYLAVALYSPALALQAAAGLPLWLSVAVVGAIGTLYTAMGGIKSVLWTDVFQTAIVFAGMSAVLVKGILHVGGLSKLVEVAREGGRLQFAELNPDPRERHSLWSCLIGGCTMWMINLFNQSSVQRFGSLKTIKDAKRCVLLNIPLTILYGVTLAFTGVLLYVYVIAVGCDPYEAGLVNNRNQITLYFVFHVLSGLPGMSGLYMSMLFSGSLSTLSSGINALAANTVEDILAIPLRNVKDATVTIIAKVLVILYGGVIIGLAYMVQSLKGPVTQMAGSVFGACGGPVLGMFLLASSCPWSNKYGAVIGTLVAMAVNIWISFGSILYGSPTRTLPPGPVHNCSMARSLQPVSFNYTINMTSPSFDHTSKIDESNYLIVEDAVRGVWGTTDSLSFAKNTSGQTLTSTPFQIYDISYLWFGVTGVVVSIVIGIIVSFLTGATDPKSVDPKLLFPFTRKLFGLQEPLHRPEDASNLIAMQNYRAAWEIFKKRMDGLTLYVGERDALCTPEADLHVQRQTATKSN